MAAGGMIVIGSSRSGKTTIVDLVAKRLHKDGFQVFRVDDKDYLMREAVRDMDGMDLYHGPIETERTRVLNPEVAHSFPRKLQLVFNDGRLLNDAHVAIMMDMRAALQSRNEKLVLLADLAYGINVDFGPGKEPLRHSGTQFMEWFRQYQILPRQDVVIREVTAPFPIRAARNHNSDEAIEDKEFNILFPPVSENERGFSDTEQALLGGQLRHIDNGSLSFVEYQQIIIADYEFNFRSRLNGEGHLPQPARK